MTKTFPLAALAVTSLLCGCAQSPAPTPDPVQLELALAALRQQERAPAAPLRKRVASADRVASTVIRVAPARLDPDVAAALLR